MQVRDALPESARCDHAVVGDHGIEALREAFLSPGARALALV